MSKGFFKNPATAFLARPLEGFATGFGALVAPLFEAHSEMQMRFMALTSIGAGIGGLSGAVAGAFSATSALGMLGTIPAGFGLGMLGGALVLGGGAAALTVSCAIALGCAFGAAGLAKGAAESIGHALRPKAPAPTVETEELSRTTLALTQRDYGEFAAGADAGATFNAPKQGAKGVTVTARRATDFKDPFQRG